MRLTWAGEVLGGSLNECRWAGDPSTPGTGRRVKLLQLSFGPDEVKRDVGGVTYTLGEGEWRDP